MEKYILKYNPEDRDFPWEVWKVIPSGFCTKEMDTTYVVELIDGYTHFEDGLDYLKEINKDEE